MDTLLRMKKARIWITQKHPFYGSLLHGMQLKVDNRMDTAYTTGTCIAFSDKFSGVLDDKQLIFVMAHEVLHCVYQHVFRTKLLRDVTTFDKQLRNAAEDYRINWDLVNDQVGTMPDLGLYDVKYDQEWTTIDIYNDLKKRSDAQERNGMSQTGSGQTLDDHSIWEELEGDVEDLQQKMTQRILGAYQAAKAAGNVPSGIDRLVGEMVQHKVPWEDLLFARVATFKAANKSWRRPNKRMLSRGLKLQGKGKAKTMNFAFAIDTSGSVSDEELRHALSEVFGAMQQLDSFTLHVMNFDTEIHTYRVYKEGDDFDFKPTGCGGTDLSCISDFIDEREINIEHLFVMTDGETYKWNAEGDGYETTFIMTTNIVAPHGETLHYETLE